MGRRFGRKPRKPRLVRDPFQHARQLATGLTAEELAKVQRTLDSCLAALRHVRYEMEHVQALNTFWQISHEIERAGIVKGFGAQIAAARSAIAAIFNRCNQPGNWHARPLYGPELQALDDMAFYYMFQIRQLSFGELRRLQDRVISRARSTGESVQRIQSERLHVSMGDT